MKKTQETKSPIAELAEIDEAWHTADGGARSVLKARREELLGRSDVAEQLGEQAAEYAAHQDAVRDEALYLQRATAGFTTPERLIAAEARIAEKLDAISERLGDEAVHEIRDRIDKIRHEPGFAFIVGALEKK